MAFTSIDQALAVRLSQAIRLSKAFRPEVQHTCAGRSATTCTRKLTMARLPDIEIEKSKLTTVLHAMSNAKRMPILNEFSDGRERSASELEGVIASLSQSALSQHLARLRRANIVRTRSESQTIY